MSLLATTQEAAETKFWRMPELIEKLLEYLDELSILSIVGVNLLAVEVLQTASKTSDILSKLIRKVLGFDQPRDGKCHGYDGYIRVKKLASSGKNLGRTKNKPLFGRFVQQV